ncbi:MAG: YggU family protein [Nitrospira sp.]|nr:YggU family protein [Nitrospira sp.]
MSRAIVQNSQEGAILTIYVQPKAARNEYLGLHGEALKFRVAAPPVEGAANDALCSFLAERFDLPKTAVTVRSGLHSRHKRVLLKGIPRRRVCEVLGIGS